MMLEYWQFEVHAAGLLGRTNHYTVLRLYALVLSLHIYAVTKQVPLFWVGEIC